ncbi:hypothetical protein BDV38DRAFT_279232 [Aspergillus pseudotamarii]|uniref:Condensation domain-containing protein n=1 Tax=Aspergillus pseudotamarii TaxID=132259 RepID=A0A5N6T507_ASPPS|nr:uncharacterized protein BDV38DRAFT_279232 [Aspergillus pseudotamarii]KAE8141329.1 hypothetical protein BDV38DRAFT_279232 [Aspergillus pseudotamarii]
MLGIRCSRHDLDVIGILVDCPTPARLADRLLSKQAHSNGEANAATDDERKYFALDKVKYHDALRDWGVQSSEVDHLMPCTPFQEGVLSNSLAVPGDSGYLGVVRLGLKMQFHVEAIRLTWQEVVEREETLLTAFIPIAEDVSSSCITSSTFWQCIFKISSREAHRLLSIDRQNYEVDSSALGFGHIPVSLALVDVPTVCKARDRGSTQLELTIYHVLYDEAYIRWIIHELSREYHKARLTKDYVPEWAPATSVNRIPFSIFVSQLQAMLKESATSF